VLLRGLGRVESVLQQPDDSPLTRELLKAARPVYGELTPMQLWERACWYGAQQGQWAIYLRSRVALIGQKEST
jgi:DNA-3-methyladenine glycosylase II